MVYVAINSYVMDSKCYIHTEINDRYLSYLTLIQLATSLKTRETEDKLVRMTQPSAKLIAPCSSTY